MNFPKFVYSLAAPCLALFLIERAHLEEGEKKDEWRRPGAEENGMKKSEVLEGKTPYLGCFPRQFWTVLCQNELWEQSVSRETAYTSCKSLFFSFCFCQRHFNDPGVQRREQQTGAPPVIPRHKLNHGSVHESTSSRSWRRVYLKKKREKRRLSRWPWKGMGG